MMVVETKIVAGFLKDGKCCCHCVCIFCMVNTPRWAERDGEDQKCFLLILRIFSGNDSLYVLVVVSIHFF